MLGISSRTRPRLTNGESAIISDLHDSFGFCQKELIANRKTHKDHRSLPIKDHCEG